jgi:RNA recognition motif-containing protein
MRFWRETGGLYTRRVVSSMVSAVGTPIESRFRDRFISAGKSPIPSVHLPPGLNCQPLSADLESKKRVRMPQPEENLMGKKLYVGNLSYDVDSSALEQLFAPHGTVQSAQIINDRDTGRSKGFGFVEMNSDAEAQAAIGALNGQDNGGRALTVNEAKPREERPRSGGGGGYGGGGGGGGYGGGGRSGGRRD